MGIQLEPMKLLGRFNMFQSVFFWGEVFNPTNRMLIRSRRHISAGWTDQSVGWVGYFSANMAISCKNNMWKILIGKSWAVQLIICGKYQYHVGYCHINWKIADVMGISYELADDFFLWYHVWCTQSGSTNWMCSWSGWLLRSFAMKGGIY